MIDDLLSVQTAAAITATFFSFSAEYTDDVKLSPPVAA